MEGTALASSKPSDVGLLSRLPVSIFGFALGVASFGHACRAYNTHSDAYNSSAADVLASLCGSLALLLILTYVVKCFVCPLCAYKELSDPNMCAVMPASGMALMQIAAAFRSHTTLFPQILWRFGIIVFILLFFNFFFQQRKRKFESYAWRDILNHFKPPMLIPIIGIAVATTSSSGMEAPEWVGKATFWLGFANFFSTCPFVLLWVAMHSPKLPKPATPTYYILIAPKCLLLAAWLSLHPKDGTGFMTTLLFVNSAASLVIVNVMFGYRMVGVPLTTAYSATTFPWVVASIGIWKYYKATDSQYVLWLAYVVFSIAVIVMVFVSLISLKMLIQNVMSVFTTRKLAVDVHNEVEPITPKELETLPTNSNMDSQ